MTTAEILTDLSTTKALTRARWNLGLPSITVGPFRTDDNPDGFDAVVTEKAINWRVPWDGNYKPFEDSGVSFARVG